MDAGEPGAAVPHIWRVHRAIRPELAIAHHLTVLLATKLPHAVTTPLPVDVHTLPRIETVDSWWTIIAALAGAFAALMSAAVALATLKLARDTAQLADATYQATQAEERRHRDGFRPHLSLHLRESVEEHLEGKATIRSKKMRLWVKNIGAGLAQNIIVKEGGDIFEPTLPTGIGAGDEVSVTLSVPAASSASTYRLVYEDVFQRQFQSWIEAPLVVGAGYKSGPVNAADPQVVPNVDREVKTPGE